jgi:hypothetical protein
VAGDRTPAANNNAGGGDRTPAVRTDATPNTGGDRTPGARTDATPNTGGDHTPNTGGDRTPNTGGDRTPNTGGDRTPNTGGDRTPNTSGDRTPNTGGDRTPNTSGDRTPNTGGDRTPGAHPDGEQGGQVTRRTGGGDEAAPPRRTADGDGPQARGDRDGNSRTDGDGDARRSNNQRDEGAGGRNSDGDDHAPPAHRDQGGDNDGGTTPHGDGDSTPDGPESAAAGDLAELGYPNPTRANADRAAAAIEAGDMPPRDTIRDTEANQRGLQELERVNVDPALSPESKANIRREVADGLRAEEPTGNLPRDVQQARATEEARVAAAKAQEQTQSQTDPAQQQTTGTPDAQGPEIAAGTERTAQVHQAAFEQLPTPNKHDLARGEIESGARVFDSQEAAATWARDTLQNDVTELPEHLQRSVNNYTNEKGNQGYDGPTYREMNGVLRADAKGDASPYDSPQVRQDIAHVNEAMTRNLLPEAVTVVRGSGHNHLDATHPADLVGTTMTEAGYLSTSLGDNGTVAAFADKDMILHLRVPEGHEALWVEPVGAFGGGERELLLGRGSSWTVDRAFIGDDGKWHVYGRVN